MPATLRSNNGEAEFTVEFREYIDYASEAGFESAIQLRGQHWDGDHTHPLSGSIDGLWLRSADLKGIRDHISHWLDRPLNYLVAEELNREFELARLPGQTIRIRIGPRQDTTSHLNPVVSITFSAGGLRGEFHFVTDQSCLALFARELSAQLAESDEKAV